MLKMTPWKFYSVSLAIFFLDQLTKHWALDFFEPFERLSVLPFFDLILTFNTGAAFSLLADAGGWQQVLFIVLGIAVNLYLIFAIWRMKPDEKLLCWAFALVLGGSMGNLHDRMVMGKVVDFLLVHAGSFHFPVFNLADCAVSIGACLLMIDLFRRKPK